ncbi:MAG TPA: hypothetical protein PKO05_02710 [Thermoanaerobaculia bacterium]|nr:hypothetical protein [Thermoanaerobaculia bacterium]
MTAGLTWLRLDADLPGHPKVRRLARALGIEPVTAIGHVVTLWCWALRYAADGDLAAFTADDLEDGAGWGGERGAFARALEEVGFVDRDDQGAELHGWRERQERVVAVRAATRERVRRHRGRSDEAVGEPEGVTEAETVPESDVPEAPSVTPGPSPVTCNAVTRYSVTETLLRNGTLRNKDLEISQRAGAREAWPGSEPEEPDGPDLEAYRSAVLALHPRPGLPVEVERELFAARDALPSPEAWRASLAEWAQSEEWLEGFAPSAARWIRGRGWRSHPPPPKRKASRAEVPQLGPRPVAPPAPELDVAERIAALAASLPVGIPGREGLVEGLAMAEQAGAKHGPDAAERMLEELERGYLGRMARGELGDVEAAMRAEQVVDQARAMVGPNRLTDAALEALRHQAIAAELGLPKLSLFGPREVAA